MINIPILVTILTLNANAARTTDIQQDARRGTMRELPELHDLIIQNRSPLRDALRLINDNGMRTCFVVEDQGILVGVLTDGDIRRSLLAGSTLNDDIARIIKREFVSVQSGSPIQEIQDALESIDVLPIVNASGQLVDYACHQRFHQIPLTEPVLDGNELEYVTDCITTSWISSQGAYVRRFESDFADYVGSPYAASVSSGTAALHLALVALGIGPGDEVIVPDLTFAATINSVIFAGATPVIADIEDNTFGLDPSVLNQLLTPKTRAVIPVHLYGIPANMDEISNFARRHHLFVIEDCAEAFGSLYRDKHVGLMGDMAIFSFFGNKTITTGEGGMLLAKTAELDQRVRLLRDHGMSPDRRYWNEIVGYNYRMTNLQAAVGVAQLERAEHIVSEKIRIANKYTEELVKETDLILPKTPTNVRNSFWFYTVCLGRKVKNARDLIIQGMEDSGVETRPTFIPLHRMPPYRDYVQDHQKFPVADFVGDAGISLPSGVRMTDKDVTSVAQTLIDQIASNSG